MSLRRAASALLLLTTLFLASACSVTTGSPEENASNNSSPPPAGPPGPACGTPGANSACLPSYCSMAGATRESYSGVTFCHAQGTEDAWLEYSTIALAQNQVETRAAQILINPQPKDLPASPKEDGPTMCKRLGGADFAMNATVRGCFFVDGSALDQQMLLKGRSVLAGTKLLALLTAKPLRPDSCMTSDLPSCSVACAPATSDLCGAPCAGGDPCAANIWGEQMACKGGRWQCESHSVTAAAGCRDACRWN